MRGAAKPIQDIIVKEPNLDFQKEQIAAALPEITADQTIAEIAAKVPDWTVSRLIWYLSACEAVSVGPCGPSSPHQGDPTFQSPS